MKRISFNAGELSPELLQRADLDAFHRGASALVNWEASQMGSLRRRRGMAPFAEAWDHSRLAPYVYSNSGNERFLIEISGDALRVLSPDSGEELVEELAYTANELNQYARIEESRETPFVPQYMLRATRFLIKTSTGVFRCY